MKATLSPGARQVEDAYLASPRLQIGPAGSDPEQTLVGQVVRDTRTGKILAVNRLTLGKLRDALSTSKAQQ